MKKFLLVASDVHSDSLAFEKLANIASSEDCLAFLYAGDLDTEDFFISNILMNRNFVFIPVLGNCDSPYSYIQSQVPAVPYFRTCQYGGKRIFISHGHLYQMPEDSGLNNNDFDIVINGHTHRHSIERDGSVLKINPGSASQPRGNDKPGFMKIIFTENSADVEYYLMSNFTKL